MPTNTLKLVFLLIVGLTAIVAEFVFGASSFTGWIAGHIPNPKNAPFVMGFGLFAAFTALFARAYQRQDSALQDTRGKAAPAGGGSTWILWVCVAIFTAAAVWFATTSGGKV